MKIGYHGTWLSDRPAGVAGSFLSLLAALSKVAPHNEYRVCTKKRLPVSGPGILEIRPLIPYRLLESMWRHGDFPPFEVVLGDVDVFHSPVAYMPKVRRAKRAMTIYDLSYMLLPEVFDRDALCQNVASLRFIERVDHILAISESTKRDIVERLRFPEERVSVVYCGIDHALFYPVPPAQAQAFVARLRLPRDFFLYVGTIEPRKNLVRLLDAFGRVWAACDRKPHLLLCGKKGWLYDDVFALMHSMPSHDHVHYLDYLPTEHLKYLMSACIAFVYPSLYEGFGLPNLEAMACGAAVVTSNVSAIPEVVGEAAVQVDPLSETELADGMRRFYEDAELRRKCGRLGIGRAAQFSWERCALETMHFYGRIA